MLRRNRQRGLSSGTGLLHIRQTFLEQGITVAVLEICLSEKALMKFECNFENLGNGGKSALLILK